MEGGWNPKPWSPLDTALSSLVDRLRASGYKHTFELEFQLEPEFTEVDLTVDPDAFFPRFREKGRAIALNPMSGRTVYCSDVIQKCFDRDVIHMHITSFEPRQQCYCPVSMDRVGYTMIPLAIALNKKMHGRPRINSQGPCLNQRTRRDPKSGSFTQGDGLA
jgi:hypothetical protein